MEFETAAQAAERLNVTVRTVQLWAKQGKLPGAKKASRDWLIPVDASPVDATTSSFLQGTFLPLSTLYSGQCDVMEFIDSLSNEDERNIALGEYYYFTGNFQKAADIIRQYLSSDVPLYRFSATFLCVYANLALGRRHPAIMAMKSLENQLKQDYNAQADKNVAAIGVFTCSVLSVQLHFSDNRIPPLENYIKYLDGGIKYFALYVIAYIAYLKKDFSRAYGIAEAALMMAPEQYILAFIHLHLIAAISLINLTKPSQAKAHITVAFEEALEYNFLSPFAVHHVILQGVLESQIKKTHPEIFQSINEFSARFNRCWGDVHNELTQKTIATNLTPTEFIIAMLYYRNWRIKEISAHIGLSERTIKNYLQIIYQKLGINGKKDLEQFMIN